MTHLGGSIWRCYHPIGPYKLAGPGQGGSLRDHAPAGGRGCLRTVFLLRLFAEELMLQLSDFRLEFLDLPLELGFSPFAELELGFPICRSRPRLAVLGRRHTNPKRKRGSRLRPSLALRVSVGLGRERYSWLVVAIEKPPEVTAQGPEAVLPS